MNELIYIDVAAMRDLLLSPSAERSISRKRIEKAGAFRNLTDRLLSFGGELLLRCALRQYCGLDGGGIRMEVTRSGKPFLPDHPEIHFNISHSGCIALCAISSGPVGCDCEIIDPLTDIVELEHILSPSERDLLFSSSSGGRRNKFFEIWAMKESYLKFTGEGLRDALGEISTPALKGRGTVVDRGNEAGCFVKSYDSIPGYAVALCSGLNSFPEAPGAVESSFLQAILN